MDKGFCYKCPSGKYLKGSACVATCDPNQYHVDGVCKDCLLSTCNTCDPSNPYKCLSCLYNKFLHNGECLNICPDKYFMDKSDLKNFKCTSCMNNCLKCNNDKYCESCVKTYRTEKGNCEKCSKPNCSDCRHKLSYCSICDFKKIMFEGSCFPDKNYKC